MNTLSHRCLVRGPLALAAIVLSSFVVARPAQAEKSLATLIPEDAGLCIEVDDLAHHGRRFLASDLYNRLQRFEPIRELFQDGQMSLLKIGEDLAGQLEMPPAELVDGLFGQRAAFGVWPRTITETNVRSGLLLFEVRDQELLRRALESVSEAQRQAGSIVAESRTKHNDETYEVRIFGRPESDTKVYFAALGKIGVVTGCDQIMQQVLQLKSQSTAIPAGSLAATEAYRAGMTRLKPTAAVKLFVNPRPWDELMRAELDRQDDAGETKFVMQALVQAWLVSDYWVSSGEFGGGVAIESYLHFNPDDLPEPLDQISLGLTGPAEFLKRVPQDAIFAFAGRIDIGNLARMFLEAGDEASLQQLDEMRDFGRGLLMGLDLFDDVLTSLGPDVGMFLLPANADAERPGLNFVAGARMQLRPEGDDRPEVAEALPGGARSMMAVASTFLNNRRRRGDEPVRIKVTEVGETKITSLANLDLLPRQVEASYALFDDYFLFGTSPEGIRKTIELEEGVSLTHSPRLRTLVGPSLSDPSQMLYIDCAPFREFMHSNRDLFTMAISMSRGVEHDMARRALSEIEQWLDLADTIVMASRVDDQGLSVSLGISTVQDEAAALTLQQEH